MSADETELPLVSSVGDAIRSVLEQDYARIEHIVVDGGSSDETLPILAGFPHLRWVSERDRGQADAVNKGFRMATGEIFGWLNADDFYLPEAISTAVELLRSSGAGLVHGGWRQVAADGTIMRDVAPVPFDYRRQLEVENRVAQPGAFFTREAFWAVGGVDPSYRYAMDYELWLKLGARFPVRHAERVLAAYRYHGKSKTVAEPLGFGPETIRASRLHGGRLFSPLYIDYYLPRYRPWLFRALIACRLIRARDFVGLVRRVADRSG
jgi:glycosyltransferase involved in cell wall biosynthesis